MYVRREVVGRREAEEELKRGNRNEQRRRGHKTDSNGRCQ